MSGAHQPPDNDKTRATSGAACATSTARVWLAGRSSSAAKPSAHAATPNTTSASRATSSPRTVLSVTAATTTAYKPGCSRHHAVVPAEGEQVNAHSTVAASPAPVERCVPASLASLTSTTTTATTTARGAASIYAHATAALASVVPLSGCPGARTRVQCTCSA